MEETDLKVMRDQITSDFQMTWKMMGETANGIDALRQTVDQGFADVAERLRQVEGRMRLTEERFTAMMEAVTEEHLQIRRNVAELRAEVEILRDLPARVEALEKRPPAA